MKYEDSVRRICGDNWKTSTQEEQDGAYGVACLMAFIRGVRPTPLDLAAHLGVTVDMIQGGYDRLERNGLFRNTINVKKDHLLQVADGDESIRAWCFVAGTASGYIGNVI